jgi:hypothetical protein
MVCRPDHPVCRPDHRGLMPANLTSFTHLAVSAAMNLPNFAAVVGVGVLPTDFCCACACNSGLDRLHPVSS